MKAIRHVLALVLPALALCACASGDSTQTPKYSRSTVQCPPGETLICEVRNTGRIRHGSFSKSGKNCACEEPKAGATVIPSVDR